MVEWVEVGLMVVVVIGLVVKTRQFDKIDKERRKASDENWRRTIEALLGIPVAIRDSAEQAKTMMNLGGLGGGCKSRASKLDAEYLVFGCDPGDVNRVFHCRVPQKVLREDDETKLRQTSIRPLFEEISDQGIINRFVAAMIAGKQDSWRPEVLWIMRTSKDEHRFPMVWRKVIASQSELLHAERVALLAKEEEKSNA